MSRGSTDLWKRRANEAAQKEMCSPMIATESVSTTPARPAPKRVAKIVLISPTATKSGAIPRFFRFPPLNLALLAALAPEHHYRIIDENAESTAATLTQAGWADIVGLTAMTAQAPRAYELADRCRSLGKTVVMGGMHVSALPDEALDHCDAVVVGEAEETWPRLLDDWGRGTLQRVYRNTQLPDLSRLPLPRRELLNREHYLGFNTLHVSRGCPFNCSFCAVSRFFGNRYRFRPVEQVIEEVRMMVAADHLGVWGRMAAHLWHKAEAHPFGFLDDNIFGRKSYSEELFEALIPLRILWGGQASINIARPENEHLLRLARRSGCRFLFVGLESVDQSLLREMNKGVNRASEYQAAIRLFHKHGISVLGAFIFGFDGEHPHTFRRTVEFANRVKLDMAQFTILTPLPGTPLRDTLMEQGRIRENDWSTYDFRRCVFAPRGMSPETLEQGKERAWHQFYCWSSILRRAPGWNDWRRLHVYGITNLAYHFLRNGRVIRERRVSLGSTIPTRAPACPAEAP